MNSMYEQFETDADTEKKGVWLDYINFRVRIARAGGSNKKYQLALDRITKQYRRAIATDNMDPDMAEDLVRKVFAQTVVLDWETKTGEEDGKPVYTQGIERKGSDELLPFNRENVLETMRLLPELSDDLQAQARSSALFRSALRDDLAGN